MNERIKKFAEQANLGAWSQIASNEFTKFAELVAADEREKCAKLVEGVEAVYFDDKNVTGDFFARCIRRRNDK